MKNERFGLSEAHGFDSVLQVAEKEDFVERLFGFIKYLIMYKSSPSLDYYEGERHPFFSYGLVASFVADGRFVSLIGEVDPVSNEELLSVFEEKLAAWNVRKSEHDALYEGSLWTAIKNRPKRVRIRKIMKEENEMELTYQDLFSMAFVIFKRRGWGDEDALITHLGKQAETMGS